MKKVIFLDIDGVLNSNFWNEHHQKEISDGILIDVEKIKILCQLIQNTKAKIVLHSGWKFWFDSDLRPLRMEAERLKTLLEREGLFICEITPDHSTDEIRKTKKYSTIKAGEILDWLSGHKEVKNWVVIEDLDLHNEEVARHQIKTDASVGLTMEDIQEAERMLNE